MSSSYHLASLSCHSRYCNRDILCHRYPCCIASASPVLFLRRASRHALFSINAVPLRDTSHVSRVTLCRFRGVSYYIGVISCLVMSVRAILLRCRPARRSRRFFFPSLYMLPSAPFHLAHIAISHYIIICREKSINYTEKLNEKHQRFLENNP